MTDRLSIALAQITQSVGDIAANAQAVRDWRAKAGDVDLVVFPELQLIGYPPEDLVLKPALIARAADELAALAGDTADGGPAMLVGTVIAEGGLLFNAVALLDGGRIAGVTRKRELPNYGTFDEKRLFAPGPLPEPFAFRGVRIGVPICEDVWLPTVPAHLKSRGAELLIAPNGSPFALGKAALRSAVIGAARVAETGLPIAFLNRVGGQDELAFDGASYVMAADGTVPHQLPEWDEALVRTEWTRGPGGWNCAPGTVALLDDEMPAIYHAMVTALRDYVNRNRFPGVILGLSGGIDSALCAAVAVDALGADRVRCVMLPSRYTAPESLEDAAGCAAMLGCRLDTIPIAPAVAAFDAMLADSFAGREPGLAQENIQSRIRGLALMALSNAFGPMLLTTGNKSEMAVGYATIYGDMAGGYNPIKDIYKTTVFALSRWRNANRPRIGLGPDGPVMPDRVISKPPSAELRPDQKDEDSLPPYDRLDRMLHALIEEEASVADLVAAGFDHDEAARIERLVAIAEYKRRQAAPGVKIGPRNFGRDRRYPITHGFRSA